MSGYQDIFVYLWERHAKLTKDRLGVKSCYILMETAGEKGVLATKALSGVCKCSSAFLYEQTRSCLANAFCG